MSVKNGFASRLAILRNELGITQRIMAQRAGLSLVYIKKLERAKKPMSKRPAVAMSIAFGVDWRWLGGTGKTYPIMARLGLTENELGAAQRETNKPFSKQIQDLLTKGVQWQKPMADKILSRNSNPNDENNPKHNKKAAQQESQWCQHSHLIYSDEMAQIISAAFNQNKARMTLARIQIFMRELAAEPWLKVKLRGLRVTRGEKIDVPKQLATDLKTEIDRRFKT